VKTQNELNHEALAVQYPPGHPLHDPFKPDFDRLTFGQTLLALRRSSAAYENRGRERGRAEAQAALEERFRKLEEMEL